MYNSTGVVTLPGDAPVGVDALDGRVFDVLEGEALPDLGTVHAHADLHRADAGQGRGGVADYLRHGASAGSEVVNGVNAARKK